MENKVEYKGVIAERLIFPDNTFIWKVNLNQLNANNITTEEIIEYLDSLPNDGLRKFKDTL